MPHRRRSMLDFVQQGLGIPVLTGVSQSNGENDELAVIPPDVAAELQRRIDEALTGNAFTSDEASKRISGLDGFQIPVQPHVVAQAPQVLFAESAVRDLARTALDAPQRVDGRKVIEALFETAQGLSYSSRTKPFGVGWHCRNADGFSIFYLKNNTDEPVVYAILDERKGWQMLILDQGPAAPSESRV
jgi:hypothetical protein